MVLDVIRIAHRGASCHAPENTLAAFQKAIDIGVDCVECDVHCTADGEVVVIHDHTLSRTTYSRGHVEKMTLAEVKKADAGSRFDPRFADEPIPTLREALELMKGKAVSVIEIKPTGIADKVLKEIEKAGATAEAVVISFHADVLKDAQKINPMIPRAFLLSGKRAIKKPAAILKLIQQAVEIGGALNLPSRIITPQLVRESHQRGVGVWAWTVDDEAEMKKLAEMGVDAITSNYPDRLNSALQ